MPLAPGALVTQNIRLVRLLGQGGMGSVWVADHLTLRTQVAVKFISEQFTHDAGALDRFSREATSAARIKSPHVVQVFDHGVFQGAPYIVMELLEGEDLAARLERGPLALGDVAAVLSQVGKALTQAHAIGIVHRDIKPANVFLGSVGGDLHVKLLDFGIAKVTRGEPTFRTTQTGQLVGTPCYMSPEQIFSRGAVDFRADLWALAVLAYEAVSGGLPFLGNTLGDMYLSINSGVHRAPTSIDRAFPPALDAFFQRAFAQSPAARFGSVRELVDAFGAIAAAAPTTRCAPAASLAASASTQVLGTAQATLGGTVSSGGATRTKITVALVAAAALGGAIFGTLGAFRLRGGAASGAPSAPPAPPAVSVEPTAPASASASASAPSPEPSVVVEPAAMGGDPPNPPPAASAPHPSASNRLPGGRLPGPLPSAKPRKKDHGF